MNEEGGSKLKIVMITNIILRKILFINFILQRQINVSEEKLGPFHLQECGVPQCQALRIFQSEVQVGSFPRYHPR